MKLLSFIAILFVLTSCTEKSGFKGSCTQSHIVKKDGFQQEEPKINMESISGYELSLKEMLCAFPHNVTFCPAVFEGTEKQPDGTLSILIRLYETREVRQLAVNYRCITVPQKPCDERFIPVQMKNSELWTYIDVCRDGEPIAPAVFEEARPFKDGVGAVRYDGMWGGIDESGNLSVNCEYQSVQDFHSGICVVTFLRDGNKWWGGVDNDGTLVFSIPDESWSADGVSCLYDFYDYDCAKAVSGGSGCLVSRDGRILLRNISDGDMESRAMRDDCFDFSYGNGTLCVRGLFDEDIFARTGRESLATLYGAFDRAGRWLVEPSHKDYAEVMAIIESSSLKGQPSSLATVAKDESAGMFGLADGTGSWLLRPGYAFILSDKDNGYFILMTSDEKFGVADVTGKVVIEPVFDDMSCIHVRPLYFCASRGGKYGILDGKGNELVPFVYDDMISFE